MGRIQKGTKCSVISCEDIAVRSLSLARVEASGLRVEGEKRAYLCTEHYKEFKKKNKDARQVEKWRWNP